MVLILLTSSLLIQACHSSASIWEYDEVGNNVSDWSHSYSECGDSHQSPIDITITDQTSNCQEPLLLQWNSQNEHFVIQNNGHSLQAIPFEIEHNGGGDISNLEILHHKNDTNIRLKNPFYNTYKSPVNSEYCFDSLHFHWSTTNGYGSEHAINGKYYPLEVHLVHYSCDYYVTGMALDAYSSGEATENYDDDNILSVIGILFEIGDANPVLDKILHDIIIDGIYKYHAHHDDMLELYYTEFNMTDLLPSNKEIIAYKGSLTTPPCFETVRWNVMKNTMTVSQEQMDIFRSMLESTESDDIMAPNWRPLQDVGDRTIYQCQEDVDALMVEKDEVMVDTMDGDNDSDKKSSDTWLIVGTLFICLFIVAMIGHIYYWIVVCREKQNVEDKNKSISLIATDQTDAKNKDYGGQTTVNIGNVNDYH